MNTRVIEYEGEGTKPVFLSVLQNTAVLVTDAAERIGCHVAATIQRIPSGGWFLILCLPSPKDLALEQALSDIFEEMELHPHTLSADAREVVVQVVPLPELSSLFQ